MGSLRLEGLGALAKQAAALGQDAKKAVNSALLKGARIITVLLVGWEAASFVGVIYAPEGTADTPLMEVCGLPEAPPYFDGTYTGPCRSGWVAKRFVRVLAD